MSIPKLTDLWNCVKKYGYNVRINKLDSLASWNAIKKELINSNAIGKWDKKIVGVYAHMKIKLGIKEEQCEINEADEKLQKEIWEKHHFYLQHSRIPILNINEPKLYRLMQVAYNAGQLKALFDDEFYTENMKTFYKENKLSEISTYMNIKYLQQMEESIDDTNIINIKNIENSIKGGNYKKNIINTKLSI